jgi:hypothetical protein
LSSASTRLLSRADHWKGGGERETTGREKDGDFFLCSSSTVSSSPLPLLQRRSSFVGG